MTDPSGAVRFAVVPAAYVFLLQGAGYEREVLLQLRTGTGYMDDHWAAAAAGHVEPGETAHEAAVREAREEIGVDGLDLAFATVMQRTRGEAAIDERVDFFFIATSWRGEPSVVEPGKNAGLRWCRLDALDRLSHPVVPHERSVLEALRSGDLPPLTSFGFPARPPTRPDTLEQ